MKLDHKLWARQYTGAGPSFGFTLKEEFRTDHDLSLLSEFLQPMNEWLRVKSSLLQNNRCTKCCNRIGSIRIGSIRMMQSTRSLASFCRHFIKHLGAQTDTHAHAHARTHMHTNTSKRNTRTNERRRIHTNTDSILTALVFAVYFGQWTI